MKFVLVGDLHLRASKPVNRIDDFVAAQEAKIRKVFEIGAAVEAPILMTGDIFDSHDAALSVLVKYLPIFKGYPHGIYSPPGNHDVYGASLDTLGRSALGVAVAAEAITLLGHEPTLIGDEIALYGHSYMHRDGRPSPMSGRRNFLVTHEMVLMDKLWREQEDFQMADEYIRTAGDWELILCGHYHYKFVVERGSRKIVNPGALVRIKASKGDMALQPGVFVYDTETKRLDRVDLTAEPSEVVFREKAKQEQVTSSLADFVSKLTVQQISTGSRFESVLSSVITESWCEDSVRDLLLNYLADVEVGGAGD